MARQLRIEFSGAFYHITSRGNDKRAIFLCDRDRERFLEALRAAYEKFHAVIHVYCLMENHFHLMLETPLANLSKTMHFINTSYTVYFNQAHEKTGHLFQGRFKAILIDADTYAQELSRYIHLNPVRSGIVKAPERYPWSSYRDYIGLRKAPLWIETGFVLRYFGKKASDAQNRYIDFVLSVIDKKPKSPLANIKNSVVLGSNNFVERVKKNLRSEIKSDRELPALKGLRTRPTMEQIRTEVEKVLGRNKKYSKKLIIFLCHKHTDKKLDEIGAHFEMNGPAIFQICHRMREAISKDIHLGKLTKEIENEIFLLNVEV
jgi:REP element-mobilizing transposase RayT